MSRSELQLYNQSNKTQSTEFKLNPNSSSFFKNLNTHLASQGVSHDTSVEKELSTIMVSQSVTTCPMCTAEYKMKTRAGASLLCT